MAPLVSVFSFIILLIALRYLMLNRLEGFMGECVPTPYGYRVLEPFKDAPEFKGRDETDTVDAPAPTTLNKPRTPYHLLSDVIPDAPRDTIGCLTARCCPETDFESRTNLTGNYLQRTNNYKRSYPDNCTGPLHEFTTAFYKTTTLKQEIGR